MKKNLIFLILLIVNSLTIAAQQLIRNFGNNHVTTSSVWFSPDGNLVLTGGYPRFYNVSTGNLEFRMVPKDQETQSDFTLRAIISRDNRTFTVSKAYKLEIWDIQSRQRLKVIRDNQISGRAFAYTNDNSKIIYLRKNGELVFIDLLSYSITAGRSTGIKNPVVFCLSSNDKQLIAGTKEGDIIELDINTGSMRSLTTGAAGIEDVVLSPDGNYIAVSSTDGRIWLGKFPSLEIVRTWQAHLPGQMAISFHPSGRFLASGGKDGLIRIWSIPDGKIEREWEAHKNPLSSISFSPSGQMIASGSLNAILSSGIDDTKLWSFDIPLAVNSVKEQVEEKKTASNDKKEVIIPDKQAAPGNSSSKKLALVIGNGNYVASILANPENDARAMKTALEDSGFDVIKYENLNQAGMKRAMDEFGARLKNYDVGLFFYAGHGIQSKGYNYLIPVDAELKSEEQVEYDCVQADRILALMEASGTDVNIIILDACRNNPFERSWSRSASGRGLAYMDAPSGTLIAYATAPGRTASDGSGQNGLYTSAILTCIKIPDISILQMFQNVRNIVSEKSAKQQIPWESTSLTGDFYFYRTGTINQLSQDRP